MSHFCVLDFERNVRYRGQSPSRARQFQAAIGPEASCGEGETPARAKAQALAALGASAGEAGPVVEANGRSNGEAPKMSAVAASRVRRFEIDEGVVTVLLPTCDIAAPSLDDLETFLEVMVRQLRRATRDEAGF